MVDAALSSDLPKSVILNSGDVAVVGLFIFATVVITDFACVHCFLKSFLHPLFSLCFSSLVAASDLNSP